MTTHCLNRIHSLRARPSISSLDEDEGGGKKRYSWQDEAASVEQRTRKPILLHAFPSSSKVVVKKVVDIIQTMSVLSGLIPNVGTVIPVVGRALVAALSAFRSDRDDQSVIIRWFENLTQKLEETKDDLERIIICESVKLQYGHPVIIIQLGMNFTLKMHAASNDEERKRYADRLKGLGSQQALTLSLDTLLKGMNGTGPFRTPILESYYSTTKGNRTKIKTLADQLMELLVGALTVIYAYETISRGETAADEIHKEYSDRISSIPEKVQGVMDKCQQELLTNMKRDLDEIIDSDKSNKEAVEMMSSRVSEKYDWLENHCIICDRSIHMEFSCTGNHVKSFGRNRRRFGIICYREIKSTGPTAKNVNRVVLCLQDVRRETSRFIHSAADLCGAVANRIVDNLHLEVSSCVVIRPKASLGFIPVFFGIHHRIAVATASTLKEKGTCSTACRYGLLDGEASGILDKRRYFLVLLK